MHLVLWCVGRWGNRCAIKYGIFVGVFSGYIFAQVDLHVFTYGANCIEQHLLRVSICVFLRFH